MGRATEYYKIPQVPSSAEGDVQTFLKAVKGMLDVFTGSTGNANANLDQVVTFRDIQNLYVGRVVSSTSRPFSGRITRVTGDVIRTGRIECDDATSFLDLDYNKLVFNNKITYDSTEPGIFIGQDQSDKLFKVNIGHDASGYSIKWDGATLVITGTITATSGAIGGWLIDSTLLRSAAVDAARIELDQGNARISVKDATGASKVVMGYLNGLAKHDGTGNWGAGDYGFWAATGDQLQIDGDTTYKSGDWIVENDGSFLVQNATPATIIRLGTDSGEKGLFLYNASGTNLAKFVTDEVYIGTVGSYLQYTVASGLIVSGSITVTGGSGIASFSDFPNYPSDIYLVGHWPLDEGSGTVAVDSSIGDHDGTVAGNPSWAVGVSGQCIDFDGSDDIIDCGDAYNPGTSDFSICAWIKTGTYSIDAAYNRRIVEKDSVNAYAFALKYTTGALWASINGLQCVGNTNVADSAWHFVVVTFDRDGNATFYLDAVADGTTDISSKSAVNLTSATHLTIGAFTAASGRFDGMIDDVRIYSRALTGAEVVALYRYRGAATIIGPTQVSTANLAAISATLGNVTVTDGTTLTVAQGGDIVLVGGSTGNPSLLRIRDGAAVEAVLRFEDYSYTDTKYFSMMKCCGANNFYLGATGLTNPGIYIGTEGLEGDYAHTVSIEASNTFTVGSLTVPTTVLVQGYYGAVSIDSTNASVQWSSDGSSYSTFVQRTASLAQLAHGSTYLSLVSSGGIAPYCEVGQVFIPYQDNTVNCGHGSYAWNYIYSAHNLVVGDWPHLDSHDDLEAIHAIRGSGKIDPVSGLELMDDDSVPEWLLPKHPIDGAWDGKRDEEWENEKGELRTATSVKKGDVQRNSEGKPYLDLSTMIALCMGGIRQMDNELRAEIAELRKDLGTIKAGIK